MCVATRPAISLTEAMTQEQLERLILLAANLEFNHLCIVLQVLARVCVATRPAISLTEAMTQEQLERLILLAANLEFNYLCITGFGEGVCSNSSRYISN